MQSELPHKLGPPQKKASLNFFHLIAGPNTIYGIKPILGSFLSAS
jgi:hypothetical protein